MLHPELSNLLETMSGKFDSSSPVGNETASWKAFRIAEQLNDLTIVQELMDYLSEKRSEYRKYAAMVLGFLAKNTGDKYLVDRLLAVLSILDEDEATLYNTLMAIWESGIKLDRKSKNVLFFITDERELIRNAAIRILGNFVSEKEGIRKALQDVTENYYDEYDLKFALESLRQIGE